MGILDRMRRVRKYRDLSQEEVAKWYGLSKQSYGRKENGREGGFRPEQLEVFVERTGIDARFLFGQIDDIAIADVAKTEHGAVTERLERIEKLIESKVPDAKRTDALTAALTKNEVRELLGLIRFWDSERINSVVAYCRGMDNQKTLDQQRERAKRVG